MKMRFGLGFGIGSVAVIMLVIRMTKYIVNYFKEHWNDEEQIVKSDNAKSGSTIPAFFV